MAGASSWIKAFRLRTLPLAFSCILMGFFLSVEDGSFRIEVLVLTLITALFLQILSNLANDYGDAQHGVDDHTRVGPMRSIQSGEITSKEMKKGIWYFSLLSLVSGIILLIRSGIGQSIFLLFLILGLSCILAALKYTSGKNPYGYRAMGDFFVFLFFGIIGVLGSYYLHGTQLPKSLQVLPASAIGFLSAAVLNLNNMRDSIPDKAAGKHTMAGILGFRTAKVYHAILITSALVCLTVYAWQAGGSPLRFTYLSIGLFLLAHVASVFKCDEPRLLDPELKKVAISTFLMTIMFGIGLLLS